MPPFLIQPEKLICKQSLLAGDQTTASTTFVAVPGTRTIFTIAQGSLLEYRMRGVITSSGGAATVSLDVAIDGYLIGFDSATPTGSPGANGAANGLFSAFIATAGNACGFSLSDILDTLDYTDLQDTGSHSFEVFYKASANSAVVHAAAASNPFQYMLIQNAATYPPYQPAGYA
jgi:hypothetical protein